MMLLSRLLALTLLDQAHFMPEILDIIKIFSRGSVLQLGVTTLTPLAKVLPYCAQCSSR